MATIAYSAERNKETTGRDKVRWYRVVERVWKDIEGNQEEILATGRFAGYKTKVKEIIEIRERPALRNKVEEENTLRYTGRYEKRWDENVISRPNGLRDNAEIAIVCTGPGPPRKKEQV